MKTGVRSITFLIILLPFLNLGCVSKSYPNNLPGKDAISVSEKSLNTPDASSDRLLFLSFKMVKAKPNNQITLINKIVSEGRMKNGWENSGNPSDDNFLLFSFLSSGDTTINLYLDHPLYKDLEMPDENGKIERNSILLDSTEFFIRTPLLKNVRSVKVTEKVKGSQMRELLQLTL